ncbi:MAG TPA: S8 family serine peptidase, partial [Phycisphaerales bacterium]|nr:S8 family serine peptidase [Phycisphaerales bacterium]
MLPEDRSRLAHAGRSRVAAFLGFERLEERYALSAAFDVVGITALRADANYSAVDGSGIGVAVIDTGLYSNHPDLSGNFVAWYDAVTRSSAGNAFDPDGHGTHVAGTAAGSNPAIGVATSARLIGIRALPADGERQPSHDTVAEGLQWVINNHATYNIKVVNMSLGVPGVNVNTPQARTDAEASRIAQLEALGVTVVTASGNSYADFAAPGASFPAVYSTIQVANTWEDSGIGDDLPSAGGGPNWAGVEYQVRADQFAATSQRSTLPNQVAAPGSTIYSAWNGSGGKLYNTISGTSMASPLVAGMVALMQDAAFTYGGVYLSTSDVLSIMRSTADDVIDAQTDNNGRAQIVYNNSGGASLGPVQSLSETGATFKRVNVYRAIQQVVAQVRGGSIDDPPVGNEDTNGIIARAVDVPAMDGTKVFRYTGNVGGDGTVNVGAADVDLYAVRLESPGTLSLALANTTGGAAGTMVIRLFGSGGAELARATGVTEAGYPTLVSDRLNPGTYYFGVSGVGNAGYAIATGAGVASAASTGDYQVSITLSNPDPNGVVQGAVPFEGLPNYFGGYIGADLGLEVGSQDVDFFEIYAPDDGTLVIDIDAVQVYGNDAVDSYVRVFDVNLNQIAFNDDDGQDTDSYLAISLVKGQHIYVAVADYWNRTFNPQDPFDRSSQGSGGLYDLYLRFSNGDVDGTVYTSGTLAPGVLKAGVVGADSGSAVGADGSKDVDFYTFDATAGGLLDLTLTSEEEGFVGSLSVWVYDPELGDVVRIAETSSTSARLIGQVAAGQTYYIAVTGRGNSGFDWFATASGDGGLTGNYSLLAQVRPLADITQLNNNSVNGGTPTSIQLAAPVTGHIGTDGSYIAGTSDVDVYVYTAAAAGSVVIRTSSPDDRSVDTYLRVFDAQGNQLAFSDDISSGTLDSGLTITLQAGQTYYIGISAAGASAGAYNVITGSGAAASTTGSYVLSITSGGPFTSSPDQLLGASSGAAGNINVTTVNTLGNPIVVQQQAGLTTWTGSDLQSKTQSPPVLGEVVTWVDPKDGRTYAAARTTSGLGLFTNTTAATWTFRNLTSETAGPVISGNITVFISVEGLVSLAGTTAAGDLVRYLQTGTSGSSGYAWAAVNLADDLRAQSLAVPQFAGRITSFVTSWNALNVVGLDSSGQIQAIWWHQSLATQGKWTTNNLSAQTGAPVLAGGLTVWLTGWNAINIGGTDQNGKLSVTWWLPEFGADWRTTNMTDLIGGPQL